MFQTVFTLDVANRFIVWSDFGWITHWIGFDYTIIGYRPYCAIDSIGVLNYLINDLLQNVFYLGRLLVFYISLGLAYCVF